MFSVKNIPLGPTYVLVGPKTLWLSIQTGGLFERQAKNFGIKVEIG